MKNTIYSDALKAGQDYRELPDVININIVDFNYPPEGDVHTSFSLRENTNPSIILSSALEIHFINMVKWRKLENKDIANDSLHRRLAWFDTNSPPELIKEVLSMDSAIMAANEKQDFVTQDEDDFDYYLRCQMAIMDYNSGINGTKREIARNALAKGSTPEFVHEITGLSLDEIEKLQN